MPFKITSGDQEITAFIDGSGCMNRFKSECCIAFHVKPQPPKKEFEVQEEPQNAEQPSLVDKRRKAKATKRKATTSEPEKTITHIIETVDEGPFWVNKKQFRYKRPCI